MNKREIRRWEKIAVAGVFAVMVFADSLTALAYPRVAHVDEVTSVMAEKVVQGGGSLAYEKISSNGVSADNFYPVIYDQELITAEGEIVEAPKQTRWWTLCIHHWREGTFQLHTRDGNGGCMLELYDCTYCLNCDTIKVGELDNVITFMKCPHDDLP